MEYSKQQINNNIARLLFEGKDNEDALAFFLMMKMVNDLDEKSPYLYQKTTPKEIHLNLLGNGVIDEKDFHLERFNGLNFPYPRLIVRLSPTCTMQFEETTRNLYFSINEKKLACTHLHHAAGDIALWIVRQKKNLETYLEEWVEVLRNASKKSMGNHMALLAIKAIFTEAAKQIPNISYEIIEQKRRARIRVRVLHTNLGMYLDAWWGSYKDTLPQQIESLKLLAEAHDKSIIKTFFAAHR